MLHDTPLRKRHEDHLRRERTEASTPAAAAARPGAATGSGEALPEVPYLVCRPPGDGRTIACELPATFGEVEAEYAALRRGAALIDCPQRGTLRITGDERLEFLDRMVTREMEDLLPGAARESFWLNRKGRIEADLLLIELGDEMFVDVDICQAARTVETLESFIFTEDVQIGNKSGEHHRIAVHGPAAHLVLATATGESAFDLAPLAAKRTSISGVDIVITRRDQTGDLGLELIVPYEEAGTVWDALLGTDQLISGGKRRVRPAGWYAYNMARIEAGTPLMNIDFGATNLPHETGIIEQRISFDKGCFLGQEVVARMKSHGRVPRTLVGLRLEGEALPVAGAAVYRKEDGEMGDAVGVVTSSTISPMLGAPPVAFAMIAGESAREGATLLVGAEGELADAIVGPLRFWSPPSRPSA
ncbi:MAG: aminomethyltransferase family protein [Planctomycetota bacterium]|nr:aminomethyltransferase family protein [Planctomycetota bacterium]